MHPRSVAKAGRPRYRIYSPGLSQAITTADFLRRVYPDAHLTGVLLAGEGVGAAARSYDRIVAASEDDADPISIDMPMGAGSTLYLVSRGDVLLGDARLTKESLRFSDKSWALDLAEAAGVPIPVTWRHVSEIQSWPVFYKSAEETEDRRRGLAGTPAELPTVTDGLIFQEVIAGHGTYGVGFIAKAGQVLASHAHFESESYPRLGGSAVLIERAESARLEALAANLIERSSYDGWGLVEFKYCPKRDDFVFMEINAKFWASWEMALLNEPRFAATLFNAEVEPARVRKMIFLDLALRRGIAFWPKALAAILGGARVRLYPGWPRQLAAALVPPFLFPWVRRLVR